MKRVLLTSKKAFYKGNLHCHSTLSDGKMTPEELKKCYKENGYSFLAITDHDHVNNNSFLDDEDFITITSAELNIKEFEDKPTRSNPKMKACHLNIYAKEQNNDITVCYSSVYDHYSKGKRREEIQKHCPEYKRVYSPEGINEIIRIANENGFFVCYNHPRWSLENYAQYSKYEGLWAVEVLNHGCNLSGLAEYDINVHDDFLRDGKKIFLSCGDDNHAPYQTCGAFVMINTDQGLNYKSIIDALLAGDFYASNGPTIEELYIEDGKVHIKCSDARQIAFSTSGRRQECARADKGNAVNEAVFNFFEEDEFFRISIIDHAGKRADTQAYFY